MKILVVTGRFGNVFTGGIERVSYEVTKRLGKKHEIQVIAHKRFQDENTTTEFPIVTISSFNVPKTNFWVYYYLYKKKQLVKKHIKNFQPDILYAHNPYDTYASIGLGVPVVSHIHSLYTENFITQDSLRTFLPKIYWNWFWKFRLHVENEALSKSNLVITYSDYLAELAKKRGAKKIKIIPNGIDTKIFCTSGKKSNLLKKPSVIFIGRIEKIKGIDYLIEAARQLSEINFYLIGEQKDKYDFPKNMILLGKKHPNQIPEFLRSADIFINPVLRDGFEIVNIEAMACGIPVITTDNFERSKIYKGVTFFIKSNDTNSIVFAIKKLLTDSSLVDNFISKGLNFSSQYDWDGISPQIEKELVKINLGNK
ncbi:glycosyltransferase family 4 protein [Nitrosopumilus piranensis]|uniref:Putative Phosphatidylinositol N-acetylglucosaminyltransferase n=1 Tax=Nitrosopumilus piranensis TaxID=1582439 RepID=A0A0C5BT48_9ARCH|nr:glycosyltransferase family 4 protein [Nitrosopumilus piranensis]AJM91324.1 putative Phosphatidylinositol N-acetylglucosaminyltransferase [Nitrosopumilus piranensis]